MCFICLALTLLASHLVTATTKGQGESQTINAYLMKNNVFDKGQLREQEIPFMQTQ